MAEGYESLSVAELFNVPKEAGFEDQRFLRVGRISIAFVSHAATAEVANGT